MEIIDKYLARHFGRRARNEAIGLDRATMKATMKAILEHFIAHAEWLEAADEMVLLESAMEQLTDRSLDDLATLELLQTVRAQVSLLRVKLANGAISNEALRRRLQRPS